jgi:hypothetical protein
VLLESTVAITNVGYALWDEVSKTYRYTSDQFTALDGTSEKDYVGVSGTYEWDLEIVHPEDRERHQKWYEDYLADPKETELEYRINHVEVGVSPIRSSDVGASQLQSPILQCGHCCICAEIHD